MPEQPTIALPLDLPDVRVLRTELTKDRELIIEVESTLTTARCRRCGQTISTFYAYDRPLLLRHLPSLGYVVYIRIRPKRRATSVAPTRQQHHCRCRPEGRYHT